MKTTFRLSLLGLIIYLALGIPVVQAQMIVTLDKLNDYNQVVVNNPNAIRDIKLVTEFINAVVITEDQAKARRLVAPTYVDYGPAMADSANFDQAMQGWQQLYQRQKNRKVLVNPISFRILSGRWKGDWVSIWGEYSFAERDKTITFPFNYLYTISEGKIRGSRSYHDLASVMTQLGYKISPQEMTK